MKKLLFSFLITMYLSNIVYANWDSPSFITNQNKNSIKAQQRIGDIVVVGLNLLAFGKALQEDSNEGLKEYLYSATTNTILTLSIKYGVNRTRPDGDSYSFPSGHSSYSFMAATFLQERYGSKFGVPALFSASYVAYSRVASKRHYVSDVLAGAIIGSLSSIYFTTPYKMNIGNTTYNITAKPYVSSSQNGITLNINF